MKTKLLTVKEGLIIIDEDAEIKKSELCYDEEKEQEFTSNEHTQLYKTESNLKVFKIIASSFIDELPKISQSVEEIRQMIEREKLIKLSGESLYVVNVNNPSRRELIDMDIFIRGYKSNKNEFTREQMIEAVNMAREFDMCKGHLNKTEQILESLEPKIDCYVEVKQICDDEKNLPYIQPIKYSITKIF